MHPRASRIPSKVVEKGASRSPPTFFGQQSIKILDLLNTASLGHVVFPGIKLIIYMSVLEKTRKHLVPQTIVVRSETD